MSDENEKRCINCTNGTRGEPGMIFCETRKAEQYSYCRCPLFTNGNQMNLFLTDNVPLFFLFFSVACNF